MDADSPWAPYVEEICLQSTRVTACLLNRGGEVLSHRGQIPASCFTALRDGPFTLGGVCKFGIHASAVKAVSVDTMGITKVTFAAHVQAFYGFDFILSTMIEPSESPHDENVVCDPVVANCLSLCTALAEYLQRTAPVILAYPTPTPSTTRKKSVVKTPARIALPPSAASDGWAALAQATLQRNQQMHEYIICSPDCQSVYHATPGAMFLKTVGMVVQEDGTEIEQVIDEAVNMSTCLVKKVKPSQGVRIHGQKYTIVQSYVDDAVSKCYTVIARRKRAGFVGCAAKHTNVICLFSEDDGQTISSTLSRVSKLCAYLSKQVL